MEVSGQLQLYPQGKSPWYPLDRRLGGNQSRSGRSGEEKNSQPPPGIEPLTQNNVIKINYKKGYNRKKTL